MKIGVMSDTHRNREYLEMVTDWMMRKHHISTLYHLGDNYADVIALQDKNLEVVQVPGIYDAEYKMPSVGPLALESVLGISILLVHSSDKDLTQADLNRANIIISGHTHKPEIRISDMVLYFNPGHLKGPMDKNTSPSFGLLDIGDKGVVATIFGIDFKEINSMKLGRSETGLYPE